MCKVDLKTPRAAALVADLLDQLIVALAAEDGCDPSEVRVGTVDFGGADDSS